jgi:hypothetical protein
MTREKAAEWMKKNGANTIKMNTAPECSEYITVQELFNIFKAPLRALPPSHATCRNCIYIHRSGNVLPCCDCENESEWEEAE